MKSFRFSLRQLLIGQAGVIVATIVVLTFGALERSNGFWALGVISVVLTLAITGSVLFKLERGFSDISRLSTALSDGDFTQSLDSSRDDEFSDIGQALNTALKRLRRVMRSIEKAAGNLNEFTSSSSASAVKTASLVEEQDTKIEMIATAMEEMTATIASVSEDVQVTSGRAEQISDQATQSQVSLEDLMSELTELVASVKESSSTFEKVEESAKGINHLLEVITGVADQTNLLALNAAIEAARAGEQGRGFAVVADEVRSLARRTQDSASEIGTMTKQLAVHISETGKVSNQASALATNASSQANGTSKAVEKVLVSIQDIADRMTAVATAVEEQQAVSEDVSRNIDELALISTQSVALTEQTSKDSSKISQLATELDGELEELTLKSAQGAKPFLAKQEPRAQLIAERAGRKGF